MGFRWKLAVSLESWRQTDKYNPVNEFQQNRLHPLNKSEAVYFTPKNQQEITLLCLYNKQRFIQAGGPQTRTFKPFNNSCTSFWDAAAACLQIPMMQMSIQEDSLWSTIFNTLSVVF